MKGVGWPLGPHLFVCSITASANVLGLALVVKAVLNLWFCFFHMPFLMPYGAVEGLSQGWVCTASLVFQGYWCTEL
jgi:hypothetical protein